MWLDNSFLRFEHEALKANDFAKFASNPIDHFWLLKVVVRGVTCLAAATVV